MQCKQGYTELENVTITRQFSDTSTCDQSENDSVKYIGEELLNFCLAKVIPNFFPIRYIFHHRNISAVKPELFWSRYTGLGSQIQTPKFLNVRLVLYLFNVKHCLSLFIVTDSHENNVLSTTECQIAKIFRGFAPGPHWGGLTAPFQDPPAAMRFFSSLHSSKNRPPQKTSGYGNEYYNEVLGDNRFSELTFLVFPTF